MKYLKPVFKGIKWPFKLLKVFLKQKAGWLDIPKILPYKGYGDATNIYLKGMVIEDKGLAKPQEKQSIYKNILATIKRFSSDEIPGVKVKAELLGKSLTTETDELGYFSFHFHFENKETELLAKQWHSVHFELLDEIVEDQPHIYATEKVRIISPEQPRIVVSDIDDTAMVSHSTQTLRKLRLMLLKDALSRNPFPGASKFYKALSEGINKKENNPFFFFFFLFQAASGIYTICSMIFLPSTIFQKAYFYCVNWNTVFTSFGNPAGEVTSTNTIK